MDIDYVTKILLEADLSLWLEIGYVQVIFVLQNRVCLISYINSEFK